MEILLKITRTNDTANHSQFTNAFNEEKSHFNEGLNNNNYYLDDPNKITIDNFIDRLIERKIYLTVLNAQLEYLERNLKFLPEVNLKFKSDRKFVLLKAKSSIEEFKKIKQSEYLNKLNNNYNNHHFHKDFKVVSFIERVNTEDKGKIYQKYLKVPLTDYAENEALYYEIKIESKIASLVAFVEIGLNYPLA